jgi:hypothetical protein
LELVDEAAGLFRGVDAVAEVVGAEVVMVDVVAEYGLLAGLTPIAYMS